LHHHYGICNQEHIFYALQAMRRAGKVSILLLLVCASTAAAVRHVNMTAAAAVPAEEMDEEGYKYGGRFVPNFESQPYKAKFLQCERTLD
jgi:hypothetical protein